MFSFLFYATVIYCCQNTCWALNKNEDVASPQTLKYDFLQNMVDFGLKRNSVNWREDNECGPNNLAPNGKPAQCRWANCCSNWGHCGNSELHCKCNGCTDFRDLCKDTGRYCAKIATATECSTNVNIQKKCEKSCGLCDLTPDLCEDIHTNCARLTNQNQCHTSVWVQEQCKKSCGLCDITPDLCDDISNYCALNTKQCYTGPTSAYVQKRCEKTCDLCDITPGSSNACSPCAQDSFGKFSHTRYCTRYIECVHGNTFYKSCKPGTRFNPYWKRCTPSSSTPCLTTKYICIPPGPTIPPPTSKCGVVKTVKRIFGGQKTMANQYPWIATIVHRDDPTWALCGGSLINKNWILTAAHCFYFDKYKTKLFGIEMSMIILGHHVLALDARMQYTPKRLIRHSQFKAHDYADNVDFATYANDIALVELKEPVEYSETISPVCLPTSEKLYLHTSVTVIGYGYLDKINRPASLMEVNLSTISNSECSKIALIDPRYKGIPQSMLCAWDHAKGGKDSCGGDSGGPLMTLEENESQYVQIGIVSAGPTCGKGRGKAGVYTRVSKYLSWIENNIKGVKMNADIYPKYKQK